MIDLSPSAATALRDLLQRKNAPPESGLRLLVQKGGCAGYQYAMKIDTPRPDDTIVERNGARLFVDPASEGFLGGSLVEFSDSLTDGGFKVTNPGATRSCGCGSSFEPGAQASDEAPPPEADASAMPCAGEDEPPAGT